MKDKIANILKEYTKKEGIMASHLILEEYAEELIKNGCIIHNMRDTDTKAEELKCCPFCGSTNVVLRHGAMWNGAVHCLDCTADVVFDAVRMIKEGDYDWQTAITKGWNNRADNQTEKGGVQE